MNIKKFIRLEVITKDRIGMTLDILDKIYNFNISLNSLEVFPKKVCVKIEHMPDDNKELLKRSLYDLEGVVSINEVELLQQEKNERKLLATIDSVDEGIMAINNKMEIEIFNNYCQKIFHCQKEEVLGTNIKSFLKINAPMVNLLQNGEKYDNIEINIENERGESHYLTTGRPVKDDNNNTIGVVASIKDIKQAIEIANVVSSTKAGAFKEIIGNCISMERVKKLCTSVAKSNSTILLRGESGTGKELFAKAIQNLSDRKSKNFVTINCAALPDNLIESELFGYEKGSFTGANVAGKEGLFKEAHEGTLFLDEIGELSMVLQAKLLRVLQEGVIRKIGSTKEEKVDVRVIAATNRNLEEMIKKEEFREDLYYRLNVIPVYIPPLRDRLEDIPSLVTFFIDKLNKKLNKQISGSELAFINALMEYNWPGNVRELQNVIERAMNLCWDNLLGLEHLIIDFNGGTKTCSPNFNFEKELKLKDIVEICEKEAIIKALKNHRSCRGAAKVLGVSHTTIINKVKKYNIQCKI
ncbi:sigma 54-interacting transcriptional regulator [Clostridium ganghwense]|uniref:HTH-type transcriptional regulatory protein TyrR n=1 Tax=Clostridium ganghwense TaxID=312089 RepID=A0ABT4CSI0_9CLOT|nr:sigma 54-interacting transcriptional regulator [Clostridium ganghwense]MCY6372012.1 sigma 54-interacting transcriptional regulator [Clostridium ganghwense]